jgi:hypothetical protein
MVKDIVGLDVPKVSTKKVFLLTMPSGHFVGQGSKSIGDARLPCALPPSVVYGSSGYREGRHMPFCFTH